MATSNQDIDALRTYLQAKMPEALPYLDDVLKVDGGEYVLRLAILCGHEQACRKILPPR